MLIPGGDAIGNKIQTDGLVVVDTYLVIQQKVQLTQPKKQVY